MGWLRVAGSLKLQVSFAKEPYQRDYSAKETCNFKEPTDRSHLIHTYKEASFCCHLSFLVVIRMYDCINICNGDMVHIRICRHIPIWCIYVYVDIYVFRCFNMCIWLHIHVKVLGCPRGRGASLIRPLFLDYLRVYIYTYMCVYLYMYTCINAYIDLSVYMYIFG